MTAVTEHDCAAEWRWWCVKCNPLDADLAQIREEAENAPYFDVVKPVNIRDRVLVAQAEIALRERIAVAIEASCEHDDDGERPCWKCFSLASVARATK